MNEQKHDNKLVFLCSIKCSMSHLVPKYILLIFARVIFFTSYDIVFLTPSLISYCLFGKISAKSLRVP